MEELDTNEELNIEESSVETLFDDVYENTEIVEYKEVEEPCVALTIIGENKLTDAEVFIKRGFRYSIKAFFSTLVLTIMNMFI
ncbi:MAG: hypothetical protein IJE59_03815 [Clostridia bacterium]|nr:hypothetical protein [Clostridia bacterium]